MSAVPRQNNGRPPGPNTFMNGSPFPAPIRYGRSSTIDIQHILSYFSSRKAMMERSRHPPSYAVLALKAVVAQRSPASLSSRRYHSNGAEFRACGLVDTWRRRRRLQRQWGQGGGGGGGTSKDSLAVSIHGGDAAVGSPAGTVLHSGQPGLHHMHATQADLICSCGGARGQCW